MPTASPHIAFDDLLTALRREGFHLSPSDYIEFTAVFNQFTANRTRPSTTANPATRADLKYYLAPILCRNREEQLKFYTIYDRYTTPPETKPRRNPGDITNPYINQKTATWFLRRASRQYYAWLFFASIVVGIARTAPILLHRTRHTTLIAPLTVPDRTTTSVTPPPDPHTHKFVAKALKPAHARSPEDNSTVIPAGPEVEKETLIHSSAFAWLFVLGFTCLCLSISFFPLRRSRNTPHVDIDKDTGDHGPLDIPFQSKDHLIRNLPVLARIARDLAQPIPTDHLRLEVNATIREAINAHGLLIPVYRPIERRPEWLVLIDKGNPLRAGLYRYLCRTLARYSLPIDYYYVDGNNNYYAEGSTLPLTRYQVRQRHGDAQLIDFNDFPNTFNTQQPIEIPEPLSTIFDFRQSGLKTIDDIRILLGDEDLFQWFCALAVFPTIRWEVALAVGAAVLKERHALDKLNFASLLRLTQFDWLATNTGSIPHVIRLDLLKQLGTAEEMAARHAILDLLRESDDIILAGTASFREKMLQVYTQSFILFSHDVRHNRTLESDARQFMTAWDRHEADDLATVLYLRNPDQKWETPVRSAENPEKPAAVERFMQELLALKVIGDPRLRALFRNLAATFFFVLLMLWLFKDTLPSTSLNAQLGLVNRDYPTSAITVNIPVTECLRAITPGHYLRVTLTNYDNNRYSQLLDLNARDSRSSTGRDTLHATFDGITMAGKDTAQPAFHLTLNDALAIDCPEKRYFTTYTIELKGDDCNTRLPRVGPAQDRRQPSNTLRQ